MDEESAFNTAPVAGPNQPPLFVASALTPKQQQQAHQKQKQQQKQTKRAAKQSAVYDRLPTLPHRDLFHRVNFTYQASVFLAHLASASPTSGPDRQARYAYGEEEERIEAGPSGSDHHDLDDVFSGDLAGSGSGAGGGEVEVAVRSTKKIGKERKVEIATTRAQNRLPGGVSREGQTDDSEAGAMLGKLARRGMKENKRMAAHNLLKLDPSLKHAICKSCSTVLMPGLTSRIRNRPNQIHMHKSHQTCLSCQSRRSVPAPPHLPFIESLDPSGGVGEEHCDISSGISAELHGPNRLRRMTRTARTNKIPFHLQEHPTLSNEVGADRSEGPSPAMLGIGRSEEMSMAKVKGHALWVADQRVMGWGVLQWSDRQSRGPTADSTSGTDSANAANPSDRPKKKAQTETGRRARPGNGIFRPVSDFQSTEASTARQTDIAIIPDIEMDEEAMFNM